MGDPRAWYTQEFMIEAVRTVRGGQSMAVVARYWRSARRRCTTGLRPMPRAS